MTLNQDENLVIPDKTIAVFPIEPAEGIEPFNIDNLNLFLNPLKNDHKRKWFTSNFYKCLPLAIGNMQGFVFTLPYSFDIYWNGGNSEKDLTITYYDDFKPYEKMNFIYPHSEFGHGILTIHFPVVLRTPPKVNLMTIAPPNYPLPGLSPMTGVVETDNLRFGFTLNIKIDIPNRLIKVLPNSPLIAIIPIPRYFCDAFELKSAYDIFDKEVIEEEKNIISKHNKKREKDTMANEKYLMGNSDKAPAKDGLYYKGMDVNGNKFKDHQLPK